MKCPFRVLISREEHTDDGVLKVVEHNYYEECDLADCPYYDEEYSASGCTRVDTDTGGSYR